MSRPGTRRSTGRRSTSSSAAIVKSPFFFFLSSSSSSLSGTGDGLLEGVSPGEASVEAAAGEEVGVFSLLDEVALLEHEDVIGDARDRETVRGHETRGRMSVLRGAAD